jgi:hypothetical protein
LGEKANKPKGVGPGESDNTALRRCHLITRSPAAPPDRSGAAPFVRDVTIVTAEPREFS